MLIRPTTLGNALYNAAHSMKRGSNSPLAKVIRSKITLNAKAYSVVMPDTVNKGK